MTQTQPAKHLRPSRAYGLAPRTPTPLPHPLSLLGFRFFIGCIGVTLVSEVMQVSGVQFHSAASVFYCVHQPQSSVLLSPCSPLCLLLPAPPLLPLVVTILVPVSMGFFSLFCFCFILSPFPSSPRSPLPSPLTAAKLFSLPESVSALVTENLRGLP